jgi:DNA-binding transcriptional MerR regulator
MEKSPEAFRTISEVADALDVPPHVLRFWETRFTQVKPVKRGGGRRYYRPEDVRLLRGIRGLLYDDGMTIKGVQKILRERGIRHVIGLGTVTAEEERATPRFEPPAAPPPAASPPAAIIPLPRREEAPEAALFDTVALAPEPEAAPDEDIMTEAEPAPSPEDAPEPVVLTAAAPSPGERRTRLVALVGALEALRAEMARDPGA